MSLALASPLPFLIGTGVLYAIDPTPYGQGVLAVLVIGAYVIQNRKAKVVATEATAKAQEIHILVNSQKDHLEARIQEQNQRIVRLEESLRVAHNKELEAAKEQPV